MFLGLDDVSMLLNLLIVVFLGSRLIIEALLNLWGGVHPGRCSPPLSFSDSQTLIFPSLPKTLYYCRFLGLHNGTYPTYATFTYQTGCLFSLTTDKPQAFAWPYPFRIFQELISPEGKGLDQHSPDIWPALRCLPDRLPAAP